MSMEGKAEIKAEKQRGKTSYKNNGAERWLLAHPVCIQLGAALLFLLFAAVCNWSLLMGENLMKWDIWDAEYPSQMLMSDALANHTLPLWDPLMRYGTPNYAIVGSPIWYPLTLLLAWVGYTPQILALSYVIHIAIGGYGMFLLAGWDTGWEKGKRNFQSLCAGIIAGLLYCGSGIFLSNAEHIMIILSAAWIPYIFYFTRGFLQKKKMFWGMAAGACAGFILMGGYPEMFYNLFLFLVPYVLYFQFRREKSVVQNIGSALFAYLKIALCTAMACCVTLLPFLCNMKLISRGNELGQVPIGFDFSSLLSLLFPGTSTFISGMEVTMVNYYVGLILILLIPGILLGRFAHKGIYLFLGAVSMLLCMGRESFLHTLIYRFFPMYDSFRFPTLSRAFLAIFLILLAVPVIGKLLEGKVDDYVLKFSRIIFGIILAGAALCALLCNFITDSSGVDIDKLKNFSDAAFLSALLIGSYLVLFYGAGSNSFGGKKWQTTVTAAVCAELLVFAYVANPITVSKYEQSQYTYNYETQLAVEEATSQGERRDRDTNFAGQKRSTSGLDSNRIVCEKTFDEEGYVSFRLKSTEDFLSTYCRSIMEQNPEVYFTNNVVTPEEVSFDEWKNACDTPSEQIYVEEKLEKQAETVQKFQPEILSRDSLESSEQDGWLLLEDSFGAGTEKTGRIRLYLDPQVKTETVSLEAVFCREWEKHYQGDFEVLTDENGKYVDLYFPDVDAVYQSIRIKSDEKISALEYVTTDRLAEDQFVDVYDFGFNSIGMTVHVPAEGYVTLLQAKHEGWTVYVDGEKTEITTVDQCFMGVRLEPGEHTVIFRFRPVDFFLGAAITGIYFILFLLLILKEAGSVWRNKNGQNKRRQDAGISGTRG